MNNMESQGNWKEHMEKLISENQAVIDSYQEKIQELERFIKELGLEKEFQKFKSKGKGKSHGRK